MARHFTGFDRISSDRAILGGKPCIRGMRLSVQRVLEIVADDLSWHPEDYPELEAEDVRQALRFAATSMATDGGLPLGDDAA